MRDEDLIDLRGDNGESFEDDAGMDSDDFVSGGEDESDDEDLDKSFLKANDKVRVKFDKFVALIMTHDCDQIIDRHMDDEIVMSTDLLADLANCHEERDEKKGSMLFVVGVVIGVVVTWLIFKK
ncbi:hypothetical protein CVV38_03915 [Candidatus Peregrinibacteria bacterium HGW-Peregrinibacteria-1]|jgi:hypothetical protein|nr:MAG: hypothetical protein CVV38_03915 [Candidatus Peregrinibacteria bacterium HGW-Peregrinibacteria-1]